MYQFFILYRLLAQWHKDNPPPETVPRCSRVPCKWTCPTCDGVFVKSPDKRRTAEESDTTFGCPTCGPKQRGRYKLGLLVDLMPDLASEYVQSENDKPLGEITIGSWYMATWKCNSCHEQFRSHVWTRTRKGTGCPNLECLRERKEILEARLRST